MMLLLYVMSAGALTWLLIALYDRVMRARGKLDAPNERSMHSKPLPVGVGLIPILLTLIFWLIDLSVVSAEKVALFLACVGLAATSWIDDFRRLPAYQRLIAQALAVGSVLYQLSPDARAIPWLPIGAERVLEGLAWVWFINLFNFMDGIDGLAGSEAVAVSLGYAATITLIGAPPDAMTLPLLIAATMLGYLAWNWHPARVLMGDAGSVPLGFLIGWLMLDLALHGHLAAALILPLFFWADSTYTLLRRLWHGRKPTEPHREHFYQRAALGCGNHAQVVVLTILANAAFIALAVWSISNPSLALVLAVVVLVLLLARLERMTAS